MSDVAEILEDVRRRGDAALREWALRLDGAEPKRAEPATARRLSMFQRFSLFKSAL